MAAKVTPSKRLAWIDTETTGLDVEIEAPIEIACVITDPELNVLAHYDTCIEAPAFVLNMMKPNVREMHMSSGLLDAYEKHRVSAFTAARAIYDMMQRYDAVSSPMCGASVHFDRKVLSVHMPTLIPAFSYRNIDVSTILELGATWRLFRPEHLPRPHQTHRALVDIRDAIHLAQWFKQSIFHRHDPGPTAPGC